MVRFVQLENIFNFAQFWDLFFDFLWHRVRGLKSLDNYRLNTFYDFRNRSKGEALEAKSKILFILKTMFDAISRILIFSIWMYVTNKGQFSSWTTFGAFYTLIAVMLVFNVIFNDSTMNMSFEYWIGKVTQ